METGKFTTDGISGSWEREKGTELMIRQAQGLALCAALAAGIAGSAAAQGQIRTADHETLPVGTVLKAKLDQRLNSAEARVGDRFTATVLSDEDGSGLPRGTRVEGVVREAKAATEEKPGVLDVDFTALRFPDGTVRRVSGSLTSLDSKSVERTSSGRLVSKRTSKDQRMTFLGYGAGAGAVIGLLTGGNLLRSALLGAAGGFLYGQLQSDKEANGRYANVDLKEGAEFGVRLDERFTWVPATATLPGNRYGQRYGEPVGHSG
ncbi:MAG: hypothetical protein K6T29_06415, partial [Peptococcaceae bacterium]|nr:hypothetical protein [Peptococcaceae bacterium]